jgi:hypothetical protein
VICPRCNTEAAVVDSRPSGTSVRRRRQCACPGDAGRFTTYELRADEIEQEASLSIRLVFDQGKPVLRAETRYLCPCGNEARYGPATNGPTSSYISPPRFCGVCDLTQNEGKGERR